MTGMNELNNIQTSPSSAPLRIEKIYAATPNVQSKLFLNHQSENSKIKLTQIGSNGLQSAMNVIRNDLIQIDELSSYQINAGEYLDKLNSVNPSEVLNNKIKNLQIGF